MKNLFIGGAAALAIAAGCLAPEDDLRRAKDFSGQKPPVDDVDCSAKECFHVTADKDISFIAVWAETCPEALVELSLYEPDWTPVNIQPQPHGQGQSCPGIDPTALKFEGLSEDHYILCVEYLGSDTVGDLVITTKAGLVCDVETYDGTCTGCNGGTGGYGGEPGAGGYGGEPGTGGKGGKGGHGGEDCPPEDAPPRR